jgi:hypothetical protein
MVNRDEIKELVRAAVEQAWQAQTETPAVGQPPAYSAPWTGVAYESHPSRLQFSISEAAACQQELLELVEAQLCTIERNRPCDHCGLCKSLGF